MCTRPKSLQNDILSEDPIVTFNDGFGTEERGNNPKKVLAFRKKKFGTQYLTDCAAMRATFDIHFGTI